MDTHDDVPRGGVGLLPRPLDDEERARLRAELRSAFPRLHSMLAAAEGALDGPDPEAALVLLGMLTARASGVIFP